MRVEDVVLQSLRDDHSVLYSSDGVLNVVNEVANANTILVLDRGVVFDFQDYVSYHATLSQRRVRSISKDTANNLVPDQEAINELAGRGSGKTIRVDPTNRVDKPVLDNVAPTEDQNHLEGHYSNAV